MDVTEDAPTGGMHNVIVRVDEAGMDDSAFGIYRFPCVVALSRRSASAPTSRMREPVIATAPGLKIVREPRPW